ncbi:hypothetical protein RJ640_020839 [Escallonia rubra]|uniref:J domain-containing protein n=1 Tax=Escallonia rubra TaxID=112253 RepID=A0AA88RD75_9ASTE|nr:hypothetical protein RJ640_020839 [Escallonia rubra]
MAIAPSSSSLSFSAQFFSGPKLSAATPVSVSFRPSPRISAAYATAERATGSRIGNSQASLYEVLGIQMGATCQDVKSAYRRLARVLHPDVAASGGQGDEFMKIHAAYSTLSDPEKRADYDRNLFRLQRPASSSFAMSAAPASEASRFSGYTRRTWETDQCW